MIALVVSCTLLTLSNSVSQAPPAVSAAPELSVAGFAPTGLHPIWEDTGFVIGHRSLILGMTNVDVGIADVVQLGLRPTSLAMRAPNGHLKIRLPSPTPRLHLAASASLFAFLPGTTKAFFSPSFSTRIGALEVPIYVAPLALAGSYRINEWVAVHTTATALWVFGDSPIQNEVTPGIFVTTECLLTGGHSVFVHAGEIGLWDYDTGILGVSYRLLWGVFEGRLGYFYRHTRNGIQRNPFLSVGLIL